VKYNGRKAEAKTKMKYQRKESSHSKRSIVDDDNIIIDDLEDNNMNQNQKHKQKQHQYIRRMKTRYSDESAESDYSTSNSNNNNNNKNKNNNNFVISSTTNGGTGTRNNNNRLSSTITSSAFLLACGNEESDYLHVTEYLTTVNGFEIKFCRIRLINNIIFFIGCIFYVTMDCIPYSGINGYVVADDMGDDYIEINSMGWLNKYVLLFCSGALLFAISSIMDLYLMFLSGCKSDEAAEILINREQARIRAQQRRKRLPRQDANMMGLHFNNNNNDKRKNDNGQHQHHHHHHHQHQNQNHHRQSLTSFVLQKGSRIGCDGTLSSCSIVAVICWLLLVGGLFGVASAILIVKHTWTGLACNLISVHLYLVQAIAMVIARTYDGNNNKDNSNSNSQTSITDDGDDDINDINEQEDNNDDDNDDNDDNDSEYKRVNTITKWMLIIGDFGFFVGSLLDAILSYIYMLFHGEVADKPQAIPTLISGILWLICAILYMLVTCYDLCMLLQEIQIETNLFESDRQLQKKEKRRLEIIIESSRLTEQTTQSS